MITVIQWESSSLVSLIFGTFTGRSLILADQNSDDGRMLIDTASENEYIRTRRNVYFMGKCSRASAEPCPLSGQRLAVEVVVAPVEA